MCKLRKLLSEETVCNQETIGWANGFGDTVRHLEHDHAVALMRWWAYTADEVFGVDGRLLAAIPNGGHRHIGAARKLKAEGVRAGMADYFLFVPRGGYHGLALELKAPVKTARVSVAQKEISTLLQAQGYVYRVCYGWDAARETIEGYLGKKVQGITKKQWDDMDSGPLEDLAEARR